MVSPHALNFGSRMAGQQTMNCGHLALLVTPAPSEHAPEAQNQQINSADLFLFGCLVPTYEKLH